MAEAQNQLNINLPQRTITITGAMTARLCQAAIRASRIDLRAMQVVMARPAVRDPSMRAIERLAQAVARFEAEITMVEKDLDTASQNTPDRRNNGKNEQRRRDARPQGATSNAGATAASANAVAGSQDDAASSGSPKGRNRNRNKNKGNGGANNAQAPSAPKQATAQKNEAPASNAQTAHQPSPVQVVASAESPAPAKQQAVAPQTDVTAHIQAL